MKIVSNQEALENGALNGDAGVPARFLFDVTGVVHWYAFFRHPSGIQRVTEKLLSSSVLRQSSQVEFVARMLGSDTFYRIDSTLLSDLDRPERRSAAIARLRAVFTQSMRLAGLRPLLVDTRYYHIPYILLGMLRLDSLVEWFFGRRRPQPLPSLEPAPSPGPRDVLFNIGDLWWQKKYVKALIHLKARTGVRIVQMIHDLFVIERPEWFQPGFARLFTEEFETLAPHVDRWLTNSHFVTGQLIRYLRGKSLPTQPITVLPMGWDSFSHLAKPSAAAQADHVLQHYGLAPTRPFILFVGTVEPRKNLASLLDALDELRRELGSRVPDLVVVGGWGWRSATVRSRLRKNPNVYWFRAVPDVDLVAFYRAAHFTVAPSHTEGWGLPVQESIAHGVPCIASSGGALPEAGAGLVVSFDPSQPAELKQAMAHWIVDEDALTEERARIARGLPTASRTTWNDAARALLKHAFG